MKKFVIAAAALLFLAPASWAGGYVGASIGQSDASVGGVSEDDSSWKIMGGYTFMKHLAVEGSYRNLLGIDTPLGSLDTTSLDVFGVGIMPVGKFDLFAKLGFARLEADFGGISDSENEIAYGIGANYGVNEKIGIRLEYEMFEVTDVDLDMISAGAVFKF